MELTHDTTETALSRQESLRVWMMRNGISYASIGRKIFVSGPNVGRLLMGETIPPHRHQQFLELGFPSELLPAPLYRKPGPKPKDAQAA